MPIYVVLYNSYIGSEVWMLLVSHSLTYDAHIQILCAAKKKKNEIGMNERANEKKNGMNEANIR